MKKVTAILVNDIHLTKDNGSLVKGMFEQLIAICKELNCNRIFCGGDVFTARSGQPLSCLTDFKDILFNLEKNKIFFSTIPGNHDKTDGDDTKSYLDVYTAPNFELFSTGRVKILSEDLAIAFIPYFSDERWLNEYENVDELIETMRIEGDLSADANTILITHSGFDGVMNNDGTKVESIIKPSMFEKWTNVLIGHYHNASKLADNVIYTGSMYQNNFGENYTDKGCTLIYSDGSIEFRPLKFPRYIKEVIDVDDSESLRNIIEKYEGENYDHVRLIFKGKKVDAKKINLAELSSLGFDAKFESVEEAEFIQIAETESIVAYDKKAIMKDFVKFCNEQDIAGDKLKFGMNLMKRL